MFFSSLFKQKENKISIVFDIGSASVGASLVKFVKNEKPKVIYSTRQPIPFQKNVDHAIFLDSMLSVLDKACLVLEKEGFAHLTFTEYKTHRIEEVFVVFSSVWYLSQTKIVKITKDKKFLFTKGLLQNIVKQEEMVFEKEYEKREGIGHVVPLESQVLTAKKLLLPILLCI